MFDTFEGFDERDVSVEDDKLYSESTVGFLGNTSEELVLSRLPERDAAIIRKGYFPETLEGLDDCRFQFVNLDFDLYQPTLEGLRFFYPRMREQGVLLVHDYFGERFLGVHEAIAAYEEEIETQLAKIPIGDNYSIAIYKTV